MSTVPRDRFGGPIAEEPGDTSANANDILNDNPILRVHSARGGEMHKPQDRNRGSLQNLFHQLKKGKGKPHDDEDHHLDRHAQIIAANRELRSSRTGADARIDARLTDKSSRNNWLFVRKGNNADGQEPPRFRSTPLNEIHNRISSGAKAKQVNRSIMRGNAGSGLVTALPDNFAAPVHLDSNTAMSPLTHILEGLVAKYKPDTTGSLASYIPRLAEVDPNLCGVCIVSTTGDVFCAGDCDFEFSMQSISKIVTYDLALMHRGKEFVLERVDVEPSGEAFNSVKTKAGGRPPNPLVNIGGMEIASMINGPFDRILEHIGKFAGRELTIDLELFECEAKTGYKNRALAYLLTDFGILCDSVENSCEKYFKQCSVMANAKDLATIGATLANNGVNPINNYHVTRSTNVSQVLSVMASCGMYKDAGCWLTEVGLPAKSGVGGGICCVVPGVMGIGVFSPLLDSVGNSHRGVKICQELSNILGLSMFQPFSMMLAAPHSQVEVVDVKDLVWQNARHTHTTATATTTTTALQASSGTPVAPVSTSPTLTATTAAATTATTATTATSTTEGTGHTFTCVCFSISSGNMSITGFERIVQRFKASHLNKQGLVLDIKDGCRFDASGLLLAETFCRRMVELGKVFLVCMAEDSPSALKLQDKLGVQAMVTSISHVKGRLIALGCIEDDGDAASDSRFGPSPQVIAVSSAALSDLNGQLAVLRGQRSMVHL